MLIRPLMGAVWQVGLLISAIAVAGCNGSPNASIPLNSAGVNTGSTSGPREAAVKAPVRRDIAKLTASATPGTTAYKIGPQDLLEISVFKVPDLSRKVAVADTGTINLPLVGEVQAAGKTAREVEQTLTRLLGAKYLQNPQVSVLVAEYNSQRVTVEGAVKKPGVYPIQGRMTLLQAIAVAQGLDTLADSAVLIFRQSNGRRAGARFDIAEIRNGTIADPPLTAGDVVVVKTSASKEAFENVVKVLPLARVFLFL